MCALAFVNGLADPPRAKAVLTSSKTNTLIAAKNPRALVDVA